MDWSFSPHHPQLNHYPSRAEHPEALPDLDTSLKTIGEHQRREELLGYVEEAIAATHIPEPLAYHPCRQQTRGPGHCRQPARRHTANPGTGIPGGG